MLNRFRCQDILHSGRKFSRRKSSAASTGNRRARSSEAWNADFYHRPSMVAQWPAERTDRFVIYVCNDITARATELRQSRDNSREQGRNATRMREFTGDIPYHGIYAVPLNHTHIVTFTRFVFISYNDTASSNKQLPLYLLYSTFLCTSRRSCCASGSNAIVSRFRISNHVCEKRIPVQQI